MGLRQRIMLLVAIGLVASTVPLGIMGLGMVRAVTDRVLEERLTLTRATAKQLGERLALGWWQLDQLGAQAARRWDRSGFTTLQQDFVDLLPRLLLFSGGLFLVDQAGRVIIQEPASPNLRFLTLTDDPTLQRVLTSGHPFASGMVHTVGHVPVVFLAAPVVVSPGRVRGAIGGVIDLTQPTLLSSIAGLAQGVSGHAVIVAHDGTVLAGTDASELFTQHEHPDFFRRFIAEGHPLVGPAEEYRGPGIRGGVHIMAFAPIPSVPWGLGIGQTEQETFGPIRRLQGRLLTFEAVVLLIALVFAWLDTSAVASPLRLLQAAADRIAGGDLDRAVDVRRGDEIGRLAKSFELMRQQLQRSLEENARLQERVLSVTLLEERERIAREMHDSVGQVLGYVNTKAQAVQALLEAGDAVGAQRQLVQLEQAARDVYADLREAILSLRTTTSPDKRLIPALQEYVARFAELSGVRTELMAEPAVTDVILNPAAELHLVRIIGEALTNVRKHAVAHHAWVRLAAVDEVLIATVVDDGVGFDPARVASGGWKGFGMQTMRERAEAIGATFAVRSTGGAGTEVEIRLPLPPARH